MNSVLITNEVIWLVAPHSRVWDSSLYTMLPDPFSRAYRGLGHKASPQHSKDYIHSIPLQVQYSNVIRPFLSCEGSSTWCPSQTIHVKRQGCHTIYYIINKQAYKILLTQWLQGSYRHVSAKQTLQSHVHWPRGVLQTPPRVCDFKDFVQRE